MEKHCSKCGKKKPLGEFHLDRKAKDGHSGQGKACKKAWGKHNRQRLTAYNAEWARQNPAKVKASTQRRYSKHKTAILQRSAEYKKRNPDRRHANDLRTKYGLNQDAHDQLLAAQAGHCALCDVAPEQNGRKKRLCVDHDHVTRAVRGLLCDKHNRAIGLFNDDPEMLARAIVYLKGRLKIAA
jgi:hypothetical protein